MRGTTTSRINRWSHTRGPTPELWGRAAFRAVPHERRVVQHGPRRKDSNMAEKTEIAWTDSTFNPWWGCSKVGPGCDHCYAEALDRRTGGDHWGATKTPRVMSAENWRKPVRWQRIA